MHTATISTSIRSAGNTECIGDTGNVYVISLGAEITWDTRDIKQMSFSLINTIFYCPLLFERMWGAGHKKATV